MASSTATPRINSASRGDASRAKSSKASLAARPFFVCPGVSFKENAKLRNAAVGAQTGTTPETSSVAKGVPVSIDSSYESSSSSPGGGAAAPAAFDRARGSGAPILESPSLETRSIRRAIPASSAARFRLGASDAAGATPPRLTMAASETRRCSAASLVSRSARANSRSAFAATPSSSFASWPSSKASVETSNSCPRSERATAHASAASGPRRPRASTTLPSSRAVVLDTFGASSTTAATSSLATAAGRAAADGASSSESSRRFCFFFFNFFFAAAESTTTGALSGAFSTFSSGGGGASRRRCASVARSCATSTPPPCFLRSLRSRAVSRPPARTSCSSASGDAAASSESGAVGGLRGDSLSTGASTASLLASSPSPSSPSSPLPSPSSSSSSSTSPTASPTVSPTVSAWRASSAAASAPRRVCDGDSSLAMSRGMSRWRYVAPSSSAVASAAGESSRFAVPRISWSTRSTRSPRSPACAWRCASSFSLKRRPNWSSSSVGGRKFFLAPRLNAQSPRQSKQATAPRTFGRATADGATHHVAARSRFVHASLRQATKQPASCSASGETVHVTSPSSETRFFARTMHGGAPAMSPHTSASQGRIVSKTRRSACILSRAARTKWSSDVTNQANFANHAGVALLRSLVVTCLSRRANCAAAALSAWAITSFAAT
mmetsp:Transcript_29965/g.100997  ORF Transcript_29965/g.100997 Transcript_29965/m.100997 type:complete len:670 (-) Transcript_29965:1524-3533(-)